MGAIALTGDQFQPWSVFDKNGNLRIGFFDRSYDSANHKYGYTVASETTAGSLNFTTTQVTTALSDPTKNNAWFGVTANSNFPGATLFLGDYSNIAVTPTGVAALWTDLRNQVSFNGQTGSGQDAFYADPRSGGPAAAPALFVLSGQVSLSGTPSSKPALALADAPVSPRTEPGCAVVNEGQDVRPAGPGPSLSASESSGGTGVLDAIFEDGYSPEGPSFKDSIPDLFS